MVRRPAAAAIGFALTLPALAAPAAAQDRGALRALVPTGEVRVHVLGVVHPPRFAALTSRVQAAMQRRPAFWQEYVRRNSRPGEPLPFDTAMGLTRAEYDELLRLAGEGRTARVGDATLRVRPEGEGRFVLDGGTALPELTGVVIDLAADRVRTPFGTSRERVAVEPGPRQATGPWAGVLWRAAEGAAAADGSSMEFGLGRLRGDGRGILYYEASRRQGGRVTERAARILTYELAGE